MSDRELERRRLRVLVASVTLLLISGGGMYLIVVALKDVALEFGWPRAVPSMAVSLLFIGSGIGGLFFAHEYFRLVGYVGVAFVALACAMLAVTWETPKRHQS